MNFIFLLIWETSVDFLSVDSFKLISRKKPKLLRLQKGLYSVFDLLKNNVTTNKK